MTVGPIRFGVAEGAFQRLSRELEIRTAKMERAGAQTARQVLGRDETLDISGLVFPEWRGGPGRVERFREIARAGEPQMLTDGTGGVWGWWLIERVTEEGSSFLANGVPQRQEFRLTLGKWGGDAPEGAAPELDAGDAPQLITVVNQDGTTAVVTSDEANG